MEIHFVDAIRANLFSPAVLFFALGMFAAIVRSDLKIPEALYVGLTVYLLSAIGFKGGVSLAESGWIHVWRPLLAAVALGTLIPLWTYPILRYAGRLSPADAAAIAGHYGSVSAVTFTAAVSFLDAVSQPYETYAAAFLAAMESPAIIVAIVLGKLGRARAADPDSADGWGNVLHEAVFGRSVLLLVGGLVIGVLCGENGMQLTQGLFVTPFYGLLVLFLLEMGTVAGRRLGDLRKAGPFLVVFGIVMPLVHGAVGVVLGDAVGLGTGGATLLAVLAASASYIAAPAAMRLSIPDANPTLYLTSSLVITFPFNVTLGIPIYYALATWWTGSGT